MHLLPRQCSNKYFFSHSRTTNELQKKPIPQEAILDESEKENLIPIQSHPIIDPKEPGAYEKIRQRNIAELEKLFRDLKISQMKTEISHTSGKLK